MTTFLLVDAAIQTPSTRLTMTPFLRRRHSNYEYHEVPESMSEPFTIVGGCLRGGENVIDT